MVEIETPKHRPPPRYYSYPEPNPAIHGYTLDGVRKYPEPYQRDVG